MTATGQSPILPTVKTLKLDPKVFIRAIPRLALDDPDFCAKVDNPNIGHHGCCAAIRANPGEMVLFERLFKPSRISFAFWWGSITAQSQTARIIALQLAALLVAEDNPAIH